MNKEEIRKRIDEIKESIDDFPFLDEEAELEKLKKEKTINPIYLFKIKKRIKELEKTIEIEKEKIKKNKLSEIKVLEFKLKLDDISEYYTNHKKIILISTIIVVGLLSIFTGTSIYNSDVRKISFISDEIVVNAGDSVDLSYVVKPNKLEESKLNNIEMIFDDKYIDTTHGRYETVVDGITNAYLVYEGKEYDSIQITINPVLVTALNCNDIEIGLGREEEISGTFLPSNATHKEILVESDDCGIVEVDGNIIKAASLGETYLTITSVDGPKCKTKVSVVTVPIDKMIIKGNSNIKRLEECQYDIDISPIDATYQDVVWTVDDESYGTIDDNGTFSAVKAGTVNIVAVNNANGLETRFAVDIDPILVESFDVVETEIRITEGMTKQINYSNVSPSTADDKSISFESSDVSIATVSENGLIKGIKPGKTKIHVFSKDGGYKTSVSVVVDEKVELTAGENQKSGITVYVSRKGIYHTRPNCSNMKYYTEMDRNDAIGLYSPCSKCHE